jgi:hypothetical protein
MNSRSVSFVERLELEFSGNHFGHAMSLGDVDGDGLNEFMIGNVDGTLSIFKGNGSRQPWKQATNLGTITCVGTGDIFNSGKIQLICINANGMCYIFSVYESSPTKSPPKLVTDNVIHPVHQQQLPSNIKVLLVASIAPNGKEELFVGHTDRFVGVYYWVNDALKLKCRLSFDGQIGSLSVAMASNGIIPQLLVSQPGGTYRALMYVETPSTDKVSLRSHSIDQWRDHHDDKESVVDMSLEESKDTQKKSLKQKTDLEKSNTQSVNSIEVTSRKSHESMTSVEYNLIACPVTGRVQRNNPSSLTEVVGDIHSRNIPMENGYTCDNIVAVCTLDGCIRFIKNEKKIWEHQVDHNLFSIAKLDVTNDGNDEIIVCSWDGWTYILDHSRNVVRYKFEDNVCAFCAGYFGFVTEHNKPCLIYSTFFNKIYIYYNITLPSISPSNLMLTLAQKEADTPEHVVKLLKDMTG